VRRTGRAHARRYAWRRRIGGFRVRLWLVRPRPFIEIVEPRWQLRRELDPLGAERIGVKDSDTIPGPFGPIRFRLEEPLEE
jgi:hypothetical protein